MEESGDLFVEESGDLFVDEGQCRRCPGFSEVRAYGFEIRWCGGEIGVSSFFRGVGSRDLEG